MGTSANQFTDCIEGLLIDHVRTSFSEDELKLQSISQSIDQVKARTQEIEYRLRNRATFRLEKLLACLERLSSDGEGATAQLQNLKSDRHNLLSLLHRGQTDCWTDLERETAKSNADTSLLDTVMEIAQCEKQIETLRTQRDQIFQEEQTWASSKKASEELLSILTAGFEPTSYQALLTKERIRLEAELQKASDNAHRELIEQHKAHSSARATLSQLEKELDEARIRASQLESARKLEWIVRRLDPRSLYRRGVDVIQRDLELQQDRVHDLWSGVTALGAKIDELGRQHEEQMEMLPNAARQKLIDEAGQDARSASMRLTEIARMSDQISTNLDAQQSDLASRKARYADEHQQYLDNHFVDTLRQAACNLEDIDTRIAALIDRQVRTEENCTRLMRIIERRRAKTDADLLNLQRQESGQLEHLEYEARRLRLRLRDRASRAGMVHDHASNTFQKKEFLRNPTQKIRVTYRRNGDEPSVLINMPILLQRRAQTGYVSKDDERLSSVIASLLGDDEPAEEDRVDFIDHFCDMFFGDDDEERAFLISLVSKETNSVLALIRPARVLPQLHDVLPGAMSISVLCRFVHGEKKTPENTILYVLDCALVPDCEPRPFERNIALVRHVARSRLPMATHALDALLDQVGSHPPVLMTELEDRLQDWQGYLDWADEQIFAKAPWAVLGPGEWKGVIWEGLIFCEYRSTASMFIPGTGSADSRQRFEMFQLESPWRWDGVASRQRGFRCENLEVMDNNPTTDLLRTCPWSQASALLVRIEFSAKEATRLVDFTQDTLLGLCNVSEAAGARTQIGRYRDALMQLQLSMPGGRFGNRLPSAPYLMASLFNVTQAATPTAIKGRLLNRDIAKTYRLNEDQGAAVEVMLASPEVAYIQGPPGTGKTTMIAAACAHFVRSGQRVLIASQTNLAVENALERLIGDSEVRPLWLSRNDSDQKRSAAIADWYRMAADHSEKAVCNTYRTLTNEVERLLSWLERAQKLYLSGNQAALELQKREDDLRRSEVRLNEIQQLQKANLEARARAAWWAMAHDALATLAEWDPSCFSPALAPETTDLLRLLATFDGKAPRLDVSPGALHRQTQERVQDIQAQLSSGGDRAKDAERIRRQILDTWPNVTLPSQGCLDGEDDVTVVSAEAEAAVLRARQSLEDAQSRANEIQEKTRTLLSEITGLLDLPEVPTDLASAIDVVERHADLQRIRLDDIKPLGDWLPLLDQWVADLRQQAENPPATDRMGERYVRSANVIGITCNSDFRILLDNGFPRFDVVIIDEVSKATPLELLRPMLLAPKTILVGDHRQLPPTFDFASFGPSDKVPTEDEDQDSLEREAELLRKYERLTTASLFRDGFAEIDAGARAALRTQYRMHPQIMSLVNRFYDGRLESGLVDPDGLDESSRWSWRTHGLSLNSRTGGQYLLPHLHVLWIDSSEDEVGRPAYEDSDGTGIGNKLEARLVAQIVEDIVDACERDKRGKSIAVATFYNRQKRLIRRALQEKLGRRFMDLQIDVETVDRFQGKEADIVIVSMVRNRSRRLGSNSNPAKFERINVAFSRARDLLVVVGARKTFERFDVAIEPVDGGPPRRTCVYGQIIEDIKNIGGLWQAKDILGTGTHRSADRRA